MHKFKDNAGREWSLELNVWQIKNLKNQIEFDARDPARILDAAADPALLCDVLYVICREQCDAKEVSDRQFGEAMTGDAIEAAAEAYIQATIDFFPLRQRQALRSLIAKIKEAENRKMTLAEEKTNGPEMEGLIQREMERASQSIDRLLAGTNFGNESGSLPG